MPSSGDPCCALKSSRPLCRGYDVGVHFLSSPLPQTSQQVDGNCTASHECNCIGANKNSLYHGPPSKQLRVQIENDYEQMDPCSIIDDECAFGDGLHQHRPRRTATNPSQTSSDLVACLWHPHRPAGSCEESVESKRAAGGRDRFHAWLSRERPNDRQGFHRPLRQAAGAMDEDEV